MKANDKCHKWLRKIIRLGLEPTVLVLEECHVDDLNLVECFWISSLRAAGAILRNMTDGGDGRGHFIVSDETKQKLSKRMAERPVKFINANTPEAMRKAWKTKRRRGYVSPMKGKKFPDDAKEKIKASVPSTTVMSSEGLTFRSVSAAARHYGIHRATVRDCARRHRETSSGIKFWIVHPEGFEPPHAG